MTSRAFNSGHVQGLFLSGLLFCAAGVLPAQETNELELLRKQVADLKENFERQQRLHQQQIDALEKQIQSLTTRRTEEQAPEVGASAGTNSPSPKAATDPLPGISPSLRARSGSAYVDLGVTGTFAAGTSTASDIEGGTQLGGHDPNQRGFTVQGLELTLSGAVDPYFRGNANILFGMDSENDTFVELEEAWLETVSLPGNLQLRVGQLLTEFGRHNTQHPHFWSFVDAPLVNARLLGPDGLRNPGARVSWLAPTPFYSELFLTVQGSQGETASSFRSGGGHTHGEDDDALPFAYRHPDNDRGVEDATDLLFTPRYAVSFDLTDTQTLLAGVSASFGPNSRGGETAGETTTEIYGVDAIWKWRPANHHGGFPFVSVQAEALLRRYDAGAFDWDEDGDGVVGAGEIFDPLSNAPAVLAGETLVDYGFYAQVLYGFKKGWVAGLRGDFVDSEVASYERGLSFDGTTLGRDPQRAERWRISPNLTWFPSEYSKIRLQYNYDQRHELGQDHSVWLQFEFSLGAHAAHKF